MNKDTGYTAYKALADRLRLSEPTIRKALSRQPTTWKTAKVISNALVIPLECFYIKIDGRRNNGGIKK